MYIIVGNKERKRKELHSLSQADGKDGATG